MQTLHTALLGVERKGGETEKETEVAGSGRGGKRERPVGTGGPGWRWGRRAQTPPHRSLPCVDSSGHFMPGLSELRKMRTTCRACCARAGGVGGSSEPSDGRWHWKPTAFKTAKPLDTTFPFLATFPLGKQSTKYIKVRGGRYSSQCVHSRKKRKRSRSLLRGKWSNKSGLCVLNFDHLRHHF